jgi:predicted NUDIX family NTP pyrophosphohydrolase
MAKAAKISAGLLMGRRGPQGWELLLIHPGGPFYARKDDGVWSLPKGLIEPGEDALCAARREFGEETGFPAEAKTFLPLGCIVQKAGKVVHAWAFEGDCDPSALRSGTFALEWPPRSGRFQAVPEADRAAFFPPDLARRKILPAQAPLIDRALEALEHAASRA